MVVYEGVIVSGVAKERKRFQGKVLPRVGCKDADDLCCSSTLFLFSLFPFPLAFVASTRIALEEPAATASRWRISR